MNLLQRISLCLLKLRTRPRLTHTPESVATPLGHVPYRGGRGKPQAWRPSVSARMRRDEREERDA